MRLIFTSYVMKLIWVVHLGFIVEFSHDFSSKFALDICVFAVEQAYVMQSSGSLKLHVSVMLCAVIWKWCMCEVQRQLFFFYIYKLQALS